MDYLASETSVRPDANSVILERRFDDIDEVADVLNLTSRRKLKLVQLSLQRFHCKFLLAEFGKVQFVFAESICPVRCTGDKLAGYLGLSCILKSDGKSMTAHGSQVSEDSLFGLDPSRAIDVVMPPGLELCNVQIKQEVFEECLQIMERSDIDQRFLSTNVLHSPITLHTIRTYLRQLKHLVTHQPHFLKLPHLENLVLEDFIPLLIDAIPPISATVVKPLPSTSRTQIVKQAEDYLMANMDQPLTLKDLCTALHVSKSPLFCGFQELFGISPMAYLKVQRLHGVRRSLKVANPEGNSVTAIAQRFGFWSAGHFARDYKQMFGELPSETIKR
jgi:AraC family ethanolamine operon transcriptional activator